MFTFPRISAIVAAGILLLTGLPGSSAGQPATVAPDGTPLACNFNFRLLGTEPASTDCGRYHIYLDRHAAGPLLSTFFIDEEGTLERMTYRLVDMPVDEHLLLLDGHQAASRIVSRRRADRIDFTVGVATFKAPPPRALRPYTTVAAERHVSPVAPAVTSGPPAAGRIVGSWVTQGSILILRADGTFSRVSQTAPGAFGGIVGVDDAGTYETQGAQVSLKGNFRTRTCSFTAGQVLDCEGTVYRRE